MKPPLGHYLYIMYAVLLFMAFAVLPIHGQVNLNNRFKNLTLQSGLADNKVNTIYQDPKGFVWFGTDYGLSRYDGSSVRNFTLNGLHNYVNDIVLLQKKTLCVRIGSRFYAFNQVTEQFSPIEMPIPDKQILGIHPVSEHKCWIIGKFNIHYCDITAEDSANHPISIRPVFSVSSDKLSSSEITAYTLSDDFSTLYFTNTSSQLIAFDLASRKKKVCFDIKGLTQDIHNILDFKDYVWIGTTAQGIYRVNKKTGYLQHFSYDNTAKEHQLSHTDIYQILPINGRQIVAVTWNGFTIFTAEDNGFHQFHTSIYNNVTLAWQDVDVRMISTYYDETENGLWIGTYGGGAVYIDLKQGNVYKYRQKSHNETRGITMDKAGYLWIATFHKGLMRSDYPFRQDNPENLSFDVASSFKHSSPILCMYNDTTQNTLWLGSMQGELFVYDCDKQKCKVVHLPEIGTIWSVLIDSKRRVWIGGDNGLHLYRQESGKCVPFSIGSDTSGYAQERYCVKAIAESNDGRIWVGIENRGLGRVLPDRTIRIGYGKEQQLDKVDVLAIHATSDRELYIGYANGLGVMDLDCERIVQHYTTRSGLYNNYIGSILEDTEHEIWVGSNSCISRFDRKNKLFFHYLLSSNNKSAYAYRQFVFWGNNRSVTYFNPRLIDIVPTEKRIGISALEIDNRLVGIGDTIHGQVILKENIYYAKKIKLNDRNRDFALSFSSLSYSNQHPQIRYRLYPYQKNWIVVDREGDRVNYNNLGAGNYRFELQAVYPGGLLGNVSRLDICLSPHWTETWWFKVLVAIALVLSFIMPMRHFQNRKRRLQYELQLEHENFTMKMEREKESQIHRERENFFTNTAHELRTPLTLIISPLQDIMSRLQKDDKLYHSIEMVYKNCKSLHTLIDHLLYVQKIETGTVRLNVTQADINELARSVGESFRPLAETKHIDYSIEIHSDVYILWIDENKITSAIQNLLSNAFKYTPDKGKITLRIRNVEIDGQRRCEITVADNGQGIPETYQQRIFDSFITSPNLPTLSSTIGIGLHIVKNTVDLHHGYISLNSVEGGGSTFTILLPEGNEHFKNDSEVLIQETPPSLAVVATAEKTDSSENPCSLLIVEDNTAVRQYICSLFSQNYTVYEAENGEEGVRIALSKIPSLIISDIMMPVKDGFACCREIRETPKTAHIPIIMLTAKAEDVDLLKATQLGIDDYITKPFNPQVLISKVTSLIKQRKRLKRIYTQTLMLAKHEGTNSADTGIDAENEFLKSVIQTIEANISNENFNVKMMAEQLNMSQPTLYRKLKEVSKLTAIDMIRSMRMSKVAALILERKYTIQEIAEKVGYNDPRTLRKHFSEQFGITPSQFIERENNGKKE